LTELTWYKLDKFPLKLTSDQVPGPCVRVFGNALDPFLSHHGTGSPDIDSDGLSIHLPQAPSRLFFCFGKPSSIFVPTKLVFHAKGGYQKHGSSHWRQCLTAFLCRCETLLTQYAYLSHFRLSYIAGAPQVAITKGTTGRFVVLSTEVASQCRHEGKPKYVEETALV
jgi:hypothetical protein